MILIQSRVLKALFLLMGFFAFLGKPALASSPDGSDDYSVGSGVDTGVNAKHGPVQMAEVQLADALGGEKHVEAAPSCDEALLHCNQSATLFQRELKQCKTDVVGVPFLGGAYLVMWFILMLVLLLMVVRQKRLRQEIEVLNERFKNML